jgi:NADH:ubiquinone oxidoreductase subunit 5 (subunit L)/multisubunit Na+/H+ antiporter MnhA subunit
MIDFLISMIPFCPMIACLVIVVLGPKVLGEKSHFVTIAGNAAACFFALCAMMTVYSSSLTDGAHTVQVYQWMSIPASADTKALDIGITLHLDSLSAIMLSMLTFVATLVAIYAGGYMHGDPGYPRFFACVSLFTFSMIMLVLSGSFLQLFMFWEAVGLCSYLLIGFWYEKPSASAAGMKAFLVNRIGDFGFAIGIFLLWTNFGSTNYADTIFNTELLRRTYATNPWLLETIALCLFMGAIGKSAQFPLHVWLPDAMEGPTPVSALIHAATMVTAGVYMVARCTNLFMLAPNAQLFVSIIGGVTALLAALIGLTQNDLKRVLAYSTVSQLGYMFLGLGTGTMLGVAGGMFHLVTHAFFKALLFLGAGSVMHAMGGVIDMRHFSGLKKLMPKTYVTFLIGSFALAGLFPLSGFWSKDTILSAVRLAANTPAHAVKAADHAEPSHSAHTETEHAASDADSHGGSDHGPDYSFVDKSHVRLLGMAATTWYGLLFWMGTFTAFLTAFYTFRAVFMTFEGEERIPPEAGHHAHESPPSMTVPLMILAVGAAGLGLVFGHMTGIFDGFLNMTIAGTHGSHGTDWIVVGLSTLAAVGGIGLAWVMYGQRSTIPAAIATAVPPLYRLSLNKFYLDEIFYIFVVVTAMCLAQFSRFLDWIVVDGLVGFISKIPGTVARLARPIQNGLVQFYALSMMLATAMLLWALLARPGWGQ